MSESEWLENNDFYIMLRHISDKCDESTHRIIGCKFARLVWDELPEIGRSALEKAEELGTKVNNSVECRKYIKKLQKLLPKNGKSVPVSAVLWALGESTSSYPAWYSAVMIGLNIIELRAATKVELCDIIRQVVPFVTISETLA